MAQVFDTPLNSNDQSLDRVLDAGLPVTLVFVDGNKALDDTLNRLARDNAGKVLVVKVKGIENPHSAQRFQVRALPAVVTVRSQETVSQAESVSGSEVEQHVAYLLGKGPKPQPHAAPPPSPRPTATAGTGAATGTTTGPQPITVTEASFDEQVLRSPQPVLVDFWAPWCGPCHTIAPTVEKLARELPGRLRVVKVNLDENPGLQSRYGIMSIPTMMVVKNGQVADRWAGALPEGALRSRVMQSLGS